MSKDVYENNVDMLNKIKTEDIPVELHNTACGSFFRLVFRIPDGEDCIPLLFEFLKWKTGKDYSEELNWIEDCLAEAKVRYEKFEEKIENNPLAMLLMGMMCD